MAFSIPRPNLVESDGGFSIEVLGRTKLKYVEGSRTIHVSSEVLAGPSGLVIYPSDRPREPGECLADLPPDERQRVIGNIQAAFRFRGFDIEVA